MGKPETQKPLLLPPLSTANLTWIVLESNPGFRGERPATNPLRHVTAPLQAGINPNYVVTYLYFVTLGGQIP